MKIQMLQMILGIVILTSKPAVYAELPTPVEEATLAGCLNLMQSSNGLERTRVIHIFDQQRKKAVHGLLAILDGQSPLEIKLDAARALGGFRAIEAAESLVKNIPLEIALKKQDQQIVNGMLTDEDFAAMQKPISSALEKIGTPAIPAVIRNLEDSDDPEVRKLSLDVLNQIEGDKDIVALRLQKALAAEKDSQKQARLQIALKELAK